MRTNRRTIPIFARVVLLAGLVTSVTRAADDGEFHYSFVLGGQLASVAEDRDVKFQEYRDVPQGAILDRLSFSWFDPSSAWDLGIEALNGFRLDDRYQIRFGKEGVFRVRTSWDRTPHSLANDATWLLAGSGGTYTYSPTFRQEIEDAAIGGTVATLMPEVLSTSARPLDLRLSRDRAAADLLIHLPAGWTLTLTGGREKRQGLGRISVGTYTRSSTAASFDAERFTVRGLEMPEPVDYRSFDFGVAGTVSRKRGFVTIGLQGSRFSNAIDTLAWDNPFEAPSSVSSSSLGLFPAADQEPSAAQGNTSSAANRGRFAQGALDLYPDSTWRRAYASGGVTLPGRTRINAAVSLATMEQDDPFLAFTRNETIIFDPGPDTMPGTGDDILARDLAPPQPSLDGEIRTMRADLRVTSHPVRPLTLRGFYRTYDYDDRTGEIQLPGYAAAGESYFRRGIGQLDAGGNKVLFNEIGDYNRSVWGVGGGWWFGRKAGVDLDYSLVRWDYDARQVDGTDEDNILLRVHLTPIDWFSAQLSWLDASRTFDGDYEVGLELSGVRAFDVWERDRTRYSSELDFMPGDQWSFGVGYTLLEDEYPGSVGTVTPFDYGLNRSESSSLYGRVGYATKRFGVNATVGRDDSDWESLSVTKSSLSGASYVANNRWSRAQDDTVDWVNLYVDLRFLRDRLCLFVDLTYSAFEGSLETVNEGTPDINSAVAYPFPDFRTDLFSGRLALRWTLTPRVDLEARYWYEPFRFDDFMWDDLQPYLQGTIKEARTSATDIQAANVERLLILDDRYSDYTANILSAVLRAHF
jgi:hypothetical protein